MSLQVQQLVKHFDGVKAVNGVSFEVRAGECVALIGPNGAGKSTCFACIAGQHRLTSGQVIWNGQRIDLWPVQQRLKAGVARTFQVAQTFEALTVLQNVQLALGNAKGLSTWRSIDTQQRDSARALLDKLGLLPLADADVLGLPYGAKKRLELAIALAGIHAASQTPRLLLLDEPAAGLAGSERAALMQVVKSLARSSSGDANTAVLYTEHNMDAVFGVADRVLVLIDGQLAAEGSPHEIAKNEAVRSRYLGKQFLGHPFDAKRV
jgi:branched-chain amino acid transport system ATP-binding protein